MRRYLALAFILMSSAPSFAAGEAATGRGVGSGIVYPAPAQALVANPAGLSDGPKLAVAGLYRTKLADGGTFASLGFNDGGLGLGAAYQDAGTVSYFQAGGSFNLGGRLRFGASLNGSDAEESDLSSDVGLNLTLGALRIGVVARNVEDIDRIDTGIALKFTGGPGAVIEFNVKKPMSGAFKDDYYLLDSALMVSVNKASFSFGYDWTYWLNDPFGNDDSGFQDGDLHAGVSLEIISGGFIEVFYRPLAQEWAVEKWAFGGRFLF